MRGHARHPILIAGVGNIFLGDDGFGCEVVRELLTSQQIPGVEVVDYGIRGLDLAYALLEPYETVILVDAITHGAAPGSIYVLKPTLSDDQSKLTTSFDAHSMDPAHLLAAAQLLGEIKAEIFIVGCEPYDLGDPVEGRMALSEVVRSSIPEAVRTIVDLVGRARMTRAHQPEVVCEAWQEGGAL